MRDLKYLKTKLIQKWNQAVLRNRLRVVQVTTLVIVLLFTLVATAQTRIVPSDSELPDRFNIIGFWPSIRDPKNMTTYEVEACDRIFSFTVPNEVVHKRPKFIANQIDRKIAEECGWKD